MALWEFTNLNKHSNFRTRIIHTKGSLSLPTKGLGGVIFANRFKYEYKNPLFPPSLLVLNNQKYIMPGWDPVIMETTLNDIDWVKPKIKKIEIKTHKFNSSSNDKIYITKEIIKTDGTKEFKCNCFGSIRAKNGECKHIKSLKY